MPAATNPSTSTEANSPSTEPERDTLDTSTNEPVVDDALPAEHTTEGEELPLSEVAAEEAEPVSLPSDEATAESSAELATDEIPGVSAQVNPEDPGGRDEALATETVAPVEFDQLDLPDTGAVEPEQPAPLTEEQTTHADTLDVPETPPVDDPEQLGLGADVAGDRSDLPIAIATGAQDEPRLELPGESMDSDVPSATADRPAESESIDLPVSSEPGMEDGGELPLASDPVQDVWGAGAVDWGNSRSGDRADNTPGSVNVEVKVPDNFMEGLEQQIEPHIRDMRTAMQDRTAAMFEDQAVLAGLNTIPE